ncbi:hypothetical protein FSP39_002302 [Pinctada imbricata]|uniref:Uncharacterized protein n=1 Tax=Pinctada imbricata TaxID=66713 RepID=A0AA88YLJ3_PINIB|nr:hypothetical protein FSP39_002302 [Pinctada imbricata]
MSLKYYPNNSSFRYCSHLNSPLILEGRWKVALVEAFLSSSSPSHELLYISSNICDDSIIEGRKESFLRRLSPNSPGQWKAVIQSPHYIDVKMNEILDIDLYVKTESGDWASFLDEATTVTLHLKAFPFL